MQSSNYLTSNQLNTEISIEIYNTFSAGKVITKERYNLRGNKLEPDNLYTYLWQNIDEFTNLYALIGKTLDHNDDGQFFYILSESDSDSDEADKHALTVQSLILIIARYCESTGRNTLNLGDPNLGFTSDDLEKLSQNAEYNAILQAVGQKQWNKAMDYLVNRGFVFKKSSDSYFFSSAGTALCQTIINAYDTIHQ